jgi:6-phosphogluconolactonase
MEFPHMDTLKDSRLPREDWRARTLLALLGLCASAALAGCGNFFVYPGGTTTTGTGTGTGSSSADFAYVSNSASGSTYLNGYSLSAGTLTATTGSPYSLTYAPAAMAITPSNTFLYIATDAALSTGYLYGYTIGTGGSLSILGGGTPLLNDSIASLDISPDGQWLFALDADGGEIEEYAINSSTGGLTFQNYFPVTGAPNGVVVPLSVKVAPSGDFILAALGTGGVVTYAFDTSTGVGLQSENSILPALASSGYYTVAVDKNNYIYAAGTVGLQVFSSTRAGAPTLIDNTPYTTGNGPRSTVIDTSDTYVYAGNQTDGTITEDTIGTNAALTAITGSPVTGPGTVSALGRDNSGKYILAAGYNGTSGVQLFTIGSAGGLTLSGSAATGTNLAVPTVVVMTH